jgi:hypothetical protein
MVFSKRKTRVQGDPVILLVYNIISFYISFYADPHTMAFAGFLYNA